MRIIDERLILETAGSGDLIDITGRVAEIVGASGLSLGNVTLFVIGSTAGITTFEFEPGLVRDMDDLYERIAPSKRHYHHDDTWGDANGFSHVHATLTGPSLTVPFEQGRMLLGTWQQVVLTEFDNRPRRREIVVQIIGEP
jgi:secondary thiamine-phosphate synthase enzyme